MVLTSFTIELLGNTHGTLTNVGVPVYFKGYYMARERGWYLGIVKGSGSIRAWHWDGIDFCSSEEREECYARYNECSMENVSGKLLDDPIFSKIKYSYSGIVHGNE